MQHYAEFDYVVVNATEHAAADPPHRAGHGADLASARPQLRGPECPAGALTARRPQAQLQS
jgi:hypothetical protein